MTSDSTYTSQYNKVEQLTYWAEFRVERQHRGPYNRFLFSDSARFLKYRFKVPTKPNNDNTTSTH